jgi:hemolysin activation/secretion protein
MRPQLCQPLQAGALGLLGIALAAAPGWSQTPSTGLPASSFPVPIEQPRPPRPQQPQPQPSPLKVTPTPALPGQPVTPSGGATMLVRQFRFSGNTVFSNAELGRITATYLNRPVNFAELGKARDAISQLYIDKGYTTSGAYIPQQTSRDGVVEIRILEGRLGQVTVEMTGRLHKNYVRSRLLRAGKGPLNVPRLLEALRLLQANPLIKTITANLSASPEPGISNLQVKVLSKPSFRAAVAMDNGRNPQTGSFRRGVDLGEANLSGFGDDLSLTYRNSDGSNDLQLSYQIPVNSSDLTLTAIHRDLYSWVIEEPLNVLNISSHYQQWFVGLRQPILRRLDQELALGLSLNKQDNKGLYLQGFPYPGRGVDENGESRVATLSFSQDWLRRSNSDVVAIRSEFAFGLKGFDTTIPYDYGIDPNSPEPNFLLWRGDGQYVRQLAKDTLLIARGRIQVTNNPLPAVEQFGLGGLGSVEGYQTNSLLTDSGLFGSIELAVPVLRWQRGGGIVQLVPFAAFGSGWDAGPAPQPKVNFLSSIGLGVQLRLGEGFFGRIDYAQRLGETPYLQSDAWQDQALLFTLRYAP